MAEIIKKFTQFNEVITTDASSIKVEERDIVLNIVNFLEEERNGDIKFWRFSDSGQQWKNLKQDETVTLSDTSLDSVIAIISIEKVEI